MYEVTSEMSLYINSSYFLEEFNGYIEKYQMNLPHYDNVPFSQQNQSGIVFNYWINIIDSPYLHVMKSDHALFQSFSGTLHELAKANFITQELKLRFPNQNLAYFIYAYCIAHEIQNLIYQKLPSKLITSYHKAVTVSNFDLANPELDHHYHVELMQYKRAGFNKLFTDTDSKRELNKVFLKSLDMTIHVLSQLPVSNED